MLVQPSDRLITIIGGSGFLGRHVVWALARRGYRIRVAVRRVAREWTGKKPVTDVQVTRL